MSKPNHKADRLNAIPGNATNPAVPSAPTGRHTEHELKTQANRGVTAGGGVKRGDRRDTHPSFSTGKVNRDGGRAGPLGASGRKSGPQSGKAE